MIFECIILVSFCVCAVTSGNPMWDGWYSDPEGTVFGDSYWIYPTYSDSFDKQLFFDAFSSKDLISWKKHPSVLETAHISWATGELWAPSVVVKDGLYYFFFGANNGAIGVGVSGQPDGPFSDLIGQPLISSVANGAQPIDPFVFHDDDGTWYMYYGSGHCNVVLLDNRFKALLPFPDGQIFKEITPEGYKAGAWLLKVNKTYYFMWSEGGWTGPDFSVAYAMSDSPLGPFKRIGTILQKDPNVATGTGHHSVIHPPNSDDYYIVYHRRPLGETNENHRVTCIDRLTFEADGRIKPVTITFEGVPAHPIVLNN